MENRFCSACGAAIAEGMYYCPNCGAATRGVSKVQGDKKTSAAWFAVPALICAVIALFFFPPIFGLIGIILGYFAFRRDRNLGILCMVLSFVGLAIGMIISYLVWDWYVYDSIDRWENPF